jgi:disulfide bond formation protein DsbB
MKLLLVLFVVLMLVGAACAPASRKARNAANRNPTTQAANSNTTSQGANNNAASQAANGDTASQGASNTTGSQIVSASTGDAAKGKTLFSSSCGACHGPEAKGLPNLGKDLTTSDFVKSHSDEQLIDFVKKGRPASDPANTTGIDMPPKGGNPVLNDENLNDIITFVRSLSE